VHPLINGLSDHDVQVINISNIFCSVPKHLFSFTRRMDNNSICKFTDLLSYENWNDVFQENNVNIIFNNFCNTYLRIFYASFPTKKIQESHKPKPWLTNGIRISCAKKRKLYVTYTNSNDPNYKVYYEKYCRVLSTVIVVANKVYFEELILKSTNKSKTTWNITNNGNTTNNIATMNINKNSISNPLAIANAFNTYFSSVAGNLIKKTPL